MPEPRTAASGRSRLQSQVDRPCVARSSVRGTERRQTRLFQLRVGATRATYCTQYSTLLHCSTFYMYGCTYMSMHALTQVSLHALTSRGTTVGNKAPRLSHLCACLGPCLGPAWALDASTDPSFQVVAKGLERVRAFAASRGGSPSPAGNCLAWRPCGRPDWVFTCS